MDVGTIGEAPGLTRTARVRLAAVAMAVLLAAAALLLVQQPADAAPAAGAAVTAQLGDIGQIISAIVCPILQSVRNAFADSPFFGFVQPILDQLLSLFGCTPSP